MAINPDYKELVDLVSEKDLDFDFPNSSTEHGKYVISKIIEKTKKNLLIFSKNLNNEVFNNEMVTNSLKENKNNIEIKVLLEESDRQTINKFNSIVKNKFHVNKIDNKKGEDNLYFVISDDKRIRICSREKPHQARVNFNRKQLGEILSNRFDTLWKSSSPIK